MNTLLLIAFTSVLVAPGASFVRRQSEPVIVGHEDKIPPRAQGPKLHEEDVEMVTGSVILGQEEAIILPTRGPEILEKPPVNMVPNTEMGDHSQAMLFTEGTKFLEEALETATGSVMVGHEQVMPLTTEGSKLLIANYTVLPDADPEGCFKESPSYICQLKTRELDAVSGLIDGLMESNNIEVAINSQKLHARVYIVSDQDGVHAFSGVTEFAEYLRNSFMGKNFGKTYHTLGSRPGNVWKVWTSNGESTHAASLFFFDQRLEIVHFTIFYTD